MRFTRSSFAQGVEVLESRRLLSGGYLDPRFSTDGLTSATMSNYSVNAVDVASRSDGKLVVAATVTSNISKSTYIDVARFNFDGSLDTSFGVNGFATSRVPGTAAAMALQSDNKIVVVGTDPKQSGFLVARFTANGDLDGSFNHTGTALTKFHSSDGDVGFANDVAIQKDGKIVVAGTAYTGDIDIDADACVARFNTNGSLDTSFGSGGQADIGLGDREYGNALTIDYVGSASSNSDYGKIVVVGDAEDTGGTTSNFMFLRLNTNGSLDKTFHKTGKFSSTFVSEYKWSDAKGVVVEPNNKIVVAGTVGTSRDSSHNFGVVRLNADGSGDSTFGPSNGQTEVDFGGNDGVHSVILSSSGDLLVGGASGGKVAMVALKSNGLIDKSFGPNGTGRVTTAGSGNVYVGGMALSADSTFVVAGGDNFATERYYDRSPHTVGIFTDEHDAYEQGKVPATFEISITPNPSAKTRVFYTLAGTATSPFSILKSSVDYSGVTPVPPPSIGGGGSQGITHSSMNTGYVDIPAGAGSATLMLTPIDDSRVESDETIIVNLAADPGYDINPTAPSAQAVIHDNDSTTTAKTLSATADAYVHDGSTAGNNFGTAKDLEVKKGSSGYNRVSYLKFDLSSFSSVNSVKLDLFGKLSDTQNASVTTSLYSVSSTSWSETGITFNNAPATSSSALASATVTGTNLQMIEFDVTAYVKAQFAAGHKVVSFALKNASSSNSLIAFNSREAGSSQPALKVT